MIGNIFDSVFLTFHTV